MSDELRSWYGLPVFEMPIDEGAELPAPGAVAWRLSDENHVDEFGHEEAFDVLWERFLERVDTTRVAALIIGGWRGTFITDQGSLQDLLNDRLFPAKDRFPALRALFLADEPGDVQPSWVSTGDVTPVLDAFPALEAFGVRGYGEAFPEDPLELRPVKNEALRVLRIESGGLPRSVVESVIASELPALEHLELWLGEEEYGCDTTLPDLEPILSGELFPGLLHLGLRNSEFQDEIAAAVVRAPVLDRLETLDLSLGTLSDEGAQALLAGLAERAPSRLRRVDLHHHYLSEEMTTRVRQTLEAAGVEVDLSEREEPDEDDDRYIALAE